MSKSTDYVLFIGGLSPQISNQELLAYFNNYGEISRAKIIVDKKTNIPKGYAYVTCKDSNTYNQILSCSHDIMGRDVDVQIAHSGTKIVSDVQNQMHKKLCVKNLALETTQNDLQAYFVKYGNVKHAYVIMNHQTKKSKQFGYVEFFSQNDCEKALGQAPHTVNDKVIDCEQFIPKAIEKKNKKNVDSKVIQEKLKDLKEKEDEAKEKRIGSPNKSGKRQEIKISRWDDDGPPCQNEACNLMSTPKKNKNLLGVDYHYHTPGSSYNKGADSINTNSNVSSYDGTEDKQYVNTRKAIGNKDKSYNEMISIDNEKLDAHKEAITDNFEKTHGRSKVLPKSGTLDNMGQFDYYKKKSGGKISRANSHEPLSPTKDNILSVGSHFDFYSKQNNAGVNDENSNVSSRVISVEGKKLPLRYFYYSEYGQPLPPPPKHRYTPSCYCPNCWRYTLKYQSKNDKEQEINKKICQVNEKGVHDPDQCYACSIAHYANKSKLELVKSVSNSPEKKDKSFGNFEEQDGQYDLNQIYHDKNLFKSPQIDRKGPPGLQQMQPIEKNMFTFGTENLKLFTMDDDNDSPQQQPANKYVNNLQEQQNLLLKQQAEIQQAQRQNYDMRYHDNYAQKFINNQQMSPPKNPNVVTYMNINNHTQINNQNEQNYVQSNSRPKSQSEVIQNNPNFDYSQFQNQRMQIEGNPYMQSPNNNYQIYPNKQVKSPTIRVLNPNVKTFVPDAPNNDFNFENVTNYHQVKNKAMQEKLMQQKLMQQKLMQQSGNNIYAGGDRNNMIFEIMKNSKDQEEFDYYKSLIEIQNNNAYKQNFFPEKK